MKKLAAILTLSIMLLAFAAPAFASQDTALTIEATSAAGTNQNDIIVAEDYAASNEKSAKAWAAALVVGIVAAAGALGMAIAISKGSDSIARQPEAAGNIRTNTMLGLVFIETAIIYALIVAILIVFVL